MPPVATDNRLLDAALLVFEQVGFRAATTRRIADEAGVNEVTLFRRYGSKEHLLLAALRRQGEHGAPPALPEVPSDPVAELTVWAEGHLRHLLRVRTLLRSTMCELEAHPELCSSAHEGPARVAAGLVRYLDALRAGGFATAPFVSETAAWMLMGALFSEAMGQDLPGRPRRDPAAVAADYVHLFTRAIGVSTGTSP